MFQRGARPEMNFKLHLVWIYDKALKPVNWSTWISAVRIYKQKYVQKKYDPMWFHKIHEGERDLAWFCIAYFWIYYFPGRTITCLIVLVSYLWTGIRDFLFLLGELRF